MECNKDEAIRAKEIAERKVTEKDYVGAKKFALKAQNLYPRLDGLNQVLVTIDVYISAENKINGDSDWYGILGVDPTADDETMKKQFRKLALMLHPDKNRCKGADGAFKLVSEAWSLLSDKAKRLSYNQKRISKETHQQRFPTRPASNGFQYGRKNAPASSSSSSASSNQKTKTATATATATFWTMCNKCKTQYEYLRFYLNQSLLCPSCRVPFTATEKSPPASVLQQPNVASHQQQQPKDMYNNHNNNNHNHNNTSGRFSTQQQQNPSVSQTFRSDSIPRTGGVNVRDAKAQVAAGLVGQKGHEKMKRGPEGSLNLDAAAQRTTNSSSVKEDRLHKRPKPDNGDMCNSFAGQNVNRPGAGAAGYSNVPRRTLYHHEIRKALKGKACSYISGKLREFKEKDIEKEKKISKGNDGEKNNGSSSEIKDSPRDLGEEDDEPIAINVPDSDFHDFDMDRSEKSFGDDQIWAAYDDEDGMPRFYARIQKVVSLEPFKMRISWLNSRSNSELGPMEWIDAGFTKTCGDFRTGKYEFTDTLNAFSHRVEFVKGARGILQIYPRKGDVWALYRNWSPEWDSNTSDEIIHKYEMVEVIDGYSHDEQCVMVTPLVKVEGFRAVFRRSAGPNDVRKIPKEEMFRFSHQVPNKILTGYEAENAPKGCRELDPAATPVDLLSDNTAAKETGGDMVNGKVNA